MISPSFKDRYDALLKLVSLSLSIFTLECKEYWSYTDETAPNHYYEMIASEPTRAKRQVDGPELPVGPSVVGGQRANPAEYPHMALLGYNSGLSDGQLEWLCGGAIISLRYILTAAHCIHTVK